MRTLILSLVLGQTFLFFCTNCAGNQTANVEPPVNATAPGLPADTLSAVVTISDLNYWIERDQFFVAGLCDNLSVDWQKISVQLAAFDGSGKQISINGAPTVQFPTFSDAVAPRGRTSFFAGWPLSAFSGKPDSCVVTGGSAVQMNPRPILVVSERSGVRVLTPEKQGDTLSNVERAWQVSIMVENPLEVTAYHPRVEALIYGTDQRLWLATLLNPEDPQQKAYLSVDLEGAIPPKGKRRFSTSIFYDNLPESLKRLKIGRVEYQAFEGQ